MTTAFNLSQVANYLNTSGQLNLATGVYGTLPQTNGGTGATSLASVAVTSLTAGTGISVSASVGAITITNTGGSGGATVTTSATDVTLTNSSNRVQQIVMTGANKLVKLPDATTMTTLGGPTFIISNNGAYAFNVSGSDGYVICPVPSGTTVTMSLATISSATAGWICSSTGPNGLAQYLSSFSGQNFGNAATRTNLTVNQNTVSICALSSTSVFIAYVNPTNLDAYGMVATISGGVVSYGTPAAIYVSTVVSVKCVAMSSTGVLVFPSNSTPSFVGIGIVVSGTSFTISPVLSYSSYFRVIDVIKLDSTRALMLYSKTSATAGAYAEVIVYNGASAPTAPGSAASFLGSTAFLGTALPEQKVASLTLIDTDKVLLFYNSNTVNPLSGTDYRMYARVATISLYTVTYGTQVALTDSFGGILYGALNSQAFAYSTTEGAIIFRATQYTNGGNNQVAYSLVATVSGTAVTQGAITQLSLPNTPPSLGRGYTFTPVPLTYFGYPASMDVNNMLIGELNTQGLYRLRYISGYGFVVGNYVCTTNAPMGFGVAALSSTQAVVVGTAVTNYGLADTSELSCAVVQIPA